MCKGVRWGKVGVNVGWEYGGGKLGWDVGGMWWG